MTDRPRHEELEERLAAEGWERRGHRWAPSGLGEKRVVLWERRNDRPGSRGWLQTHVPYHAGPSYDADCDQVLVDMAHARGEAWGTALRERDEFRAEVERLKAEEERGVRDYLELRDHADQLQVERDELRAKLAKLEPERVEAVRSTIETTQECARLRAEVERLKAVKGVDAVLRGVRFRDGTTVGDVQNAHARAEKAEAEVERLRATNATLELVAKACQGVARAALPLEVKRALAALDEAAGAEPERGGS